MRSTNARRTWMTIVMVLLGITLISIGVRYAPWGFGGLILLVGLGLILPEEPSRAKLNVAGVAHHELGDPNGPAGVGAVLKTESGEVLGEIARDIGTTTNTVADYTALIEGLQMALDKGVKEVQINVDSPVIVGHLLDGHPVRADHLRPLVEQARQSLDAFSNWSLARVPRWMNVDADRLAAHAIGGAPVIFHADRPTLQGGTS